MFFILNTTDLIYFGKIFGLVRDLNPGPLAPKVRIIPLDQPAIPTKLKLNLGRLEVRARPITIPLTEVFQLAVTETLVLNILNLEPDH